MQAFILMSASCQTADCHVSWLRLSSLPVSCWVFCCMCTYTLSCLPYQALSNLSALCSPLSADLNAPMSLSHWMHTEPCSTEGTVGLSEAGGVFWCLGISWAWRNACGIFCNPIYNLLLQPCMCSSTLLRCFVCSCLPPFSLQKTYSSWKKTIKIILSNL